MRRSRWEINCKESLQLALWPSGSIPVYIYIPRKKDIKLKDHTQFRRIQRIPHYSAEVLRILSCSRGSRGSIPILENPKNRALLGKIMTRPNSIQGSTEDHAVFRWI